MLGYSSCPPRGFAADREADERPKEGWNRIVNEATISSWARRFVAEFMQRLGLKKQVPAPLHPYANPPSAAMSGSERICCAWSWPRTDNERRPASRWRRGEPQRNGDAYVTAPRSNDESGRVNRAKRAPATPRRKGLSAGHCFELALDACPACDALSRRARQWGLRLGRARKFLKAACRSQASCSSSQNAASLRK
jgi:hypothetical protein